MTYRADSEVLYPYGWLSGKSSPASSTPRTWLKPHPTSRALVAKVRALGSRKPVAWLVSNCQKHVPVEIFGRCGKPLKCTKGRDECFEEIVQQYKFYLAFENSLCKDQT